MNARETSGTLFPIAFTHLTSPEALLSGFCVLYLVYLVALGFYRLYLTPSARFPGPKLAALTFLYEFYYDAWLEGQYTWKIRDLHRKYGPFVRVNPYEVHCDDPEFFDILYVSSAKRRTDKWEWAIRQSWTRNSTFKTIAHDLHRQRRSQLNPFFSKASVRKLEPLIVGKIDRLCSRLEESRDAVMLTHAFAALTVDVISRVCFGVSNGFLELDGFAGELYKGIVSSSRSAHLLRQFPWLFRLLGWVPGLASPATSAAMVAEQQSRMKLTRNVIAVVERHARGEKPAPGDAFTVFHAMLDGDVPPEEKSVGRLIEEAHTLNGAGTMTTANALEKTLFYLLTDSDSLARLRRELEAAIPDPKIIPSTAELEQLPFLTAVVQEGLRLSKGVTHRLARVSPDVSYNYGDVVIPRGVPVGMSFMDILEGLYLMSKLKHMLDPTIFPDPDAFTPERWLPPDEAEVRQRRKSLLTVFGGGTRMCVGLNLAWAELYLTIAAVVRRFGGRLQLHDDVVFERDIKITVDGFNALSSRESKGLRVFVRPSVK
ncbi:putative P450 monooxygenase [Whalleya microplaca]|nr:putative P450 monooxygenase [Whalleya microplaca]